MQTSSNKSVGIASLGSIGDIKLSQVPKLEDCNPGFEPTEYNIVIAPAVIEEKVGSIIMATETHDRLKDAAQLGRLVAVSPVAFNYERWPDGAGPPQVGDVVWFARFAGGTFDGVDGKTYRIVKDKDIAGVIPYDGDE